MMKKRILAIISCGILVAATAGSGTALAASLENEENLTMLQSESSEKKEGTFAPVFEGPYEVENLDGHKAIGYKVINDTEDNIYAGLIVEFMNEFNECIGTSSAYIPCIASGDSAYIYAEDNYTESFNNFTTLNFYGISDYVSAADALSVLNYTEEDNSLCFSVENTSSEKIYSPQLIVAFQENSEIIAMYSGMLTDGTGNIYLDAGSTGSINIDCPEEYDNCDCWMAAFYDYDNIDETDSSDVAINSKLTSITLKDLKDYIDLDSTIYVVQGTNVSDISEFSYDSDVIKSVSLDTSGVDTNATPDPLWAVFDADYVIVVDTNELCTKENKINGMTGDTAQVAGTIEVHVITQDFADSMVTNGANPEAIIGYTVSNNMSNSSGETTVDNNESDSYLSGEIVRSLTRGDAVQVPLDEEFHTTVSRILALYKFTTTNNDGSNYTLNITDLSSEKNLVWLNFYDDSANHLGSAKLYNTDGSITVNLEDMLADSVYYVALNIEGDEYFTDSDVQEVEVVMTIEETK